MSSNNKSLTGNTAVSLSQPVIPVSSTHATMVNSSADAINHLSSTSDTVITTATTTTSGSGAIVANNHHTTQSSTHTSTDSQDVVNTDDNSTDDCPYLSSTIKIAVIGNVDSGKSSLVGVLVSNQYDDGRGSARAVVFAHSHEAETGRTSCASYHLYGYNNGKPVTVNNPTELRNKNKSWGHITSNSQRLVSLIDLAGHEKYLRTTVTALIGVYPDIALVVVNPATGVSRMTREHIGLAIALKLRMVVVVTKIDRADVSHLKRVRKEIVGLLQSSQAGRIPITIKNEDDVKECVNSVDDTIVPVFYVSSVTGQNFPLLHSYLSRVKPCIWNVSTDLSRGHLVNNSDDLSNTTVTTTTTTATTANGIGHPSDLEEGSLSTSSSISTTGTSTSSTTSSVTAAAAAGTSTHLLHRDVVLSTHEHTFIAMEMRVDDRFQVKHHGLVLSGTVTIGSTHLNQKAYLGPFGRHHVEFLPVVIKSIHMHRHHVNHAGLGDGVSLCIKFDKTRANKKSKIVIHKDITKDMITKGMVVIAMKDVDPVSLIPSPGVTGTSTMVTAAKAAAVSTSVAAGKATGTTTVSPTTAVAKEEGNTTTTTTAATTTVANVNPSHTHPTWQAFVACGADIELYVLNNHSSMNERYQAMLHCGSLSLPMTFDQILVATPSHHHHHHTAVATATTTASVSSSPHVITRLSDVFTDTTVSEVKRRYNLEQFANGKHRQLKLTTTATTSTTVDSEHVVNDSNNKQAHHHQVSSDVDLKEDQDVGIPTATTTTSAGTTTAIRQQGSTHNHQHHLHHTLTSTTLRSGDRAIVRVRFLQHRRAYIREGEIILLREGSTKALGRVIQIHTDYSVFANYHSGQQDKA